MPVRPTLIAVPEGGSSVRPVCPLVQRNQPSVGKHRSPAPARGKMRLLAMLDVKHLRKSFGSLVAVDDVSFAVERGQLVGLLGPNGAGKTTTVSMIAGLVTPEQGEVLIGGARLARRHRSEEAPDRPRAAGPRAVRRAVRARRTCASSARSTA